MGTEAFWVPFAISAATSAAAGGAAYINQRNTAKRQDSELAAQLRASGQKQQQADAKTAALIASEAKSTAAPERAKIAADFGKEVATKMPQATSGLNVPGGASAAYEKAGSDRALGIADYANTRAGNIADIDAPYAQRLDEKINRGRFGTDISQIDRFNRGDNYLSNLRLSQIKGNPKLALFSSLVGGAGNAAAKGAGAYYGGAGDSFGTGAWEGSPTLQNNLPDIFNFNAAQKPFSPYDPNRTEQTWS